MIVYYSHVTFLTISTPFLFVFCSVGMHGPSSRGSQRKSRSRQDFSRTKSRLGPDRRRGKAIDSAWFKSDQFVGQSVFQFVIWSMSPRLEFYCLPMKFEWQIFLFLHVVLCLTEREHGFARSRLEWILALRGSVGPSQGQHLHQKQNWLFSTPLGQPKWPQSKRKNHPTCR